MDSEVYLDQLKKSLTGIAWEDKCMIVDQLGPFDLDTRIRGNDWPATAFTMIGMQRLDNLQYCINEILKNNVKGDLIETGVWRGGACIFMRGMLKAYDITDRVVWVADSFKGFPPPRQDNPYDKLSSLDTIDSLRVSADQVRSNFAKFSLLDDQVKFLEGYFSDTLPSFSVEKLALLRLDSDTYETTTIEYKYLYPKLSLGGYVIVDDYTAHQGSRAATNEFRESNGIKTEMMEICKTGSMYWKKD